MPNKDLATITVCVRGSVNNPGRQTLTPPFTIEHAIKQARGYDQSRAYIDRSVRVLHKDGSEIKVKQAEYSVFILADGDYIDIFQD